METTNQTKLSQSQKEILRNKFIECARFYNHYLMDKIFLVFTENEQIHKITFLRKDFQHLAGIKVKVSERVFFNMCLNDELPNDVIQNLQKYNFRTLMSKVQILEKLQYILHSDASTNLVLEELTTHTTKFPVAIRNDEQDIAIGFMGKDLHARSTRKAHTSLNCKNSSRIIAIFELNPDTDKGEKIVYLRGFNYLNLHFDSLKDVLSSALLDKLQKKELVKG